MGARVGAGRLAGRRRRARGGSAWCGSRAGRGPRRRGRGRRVRPRAGRRRPARRGRGLAQGRRGIGRRCAKFGACGGHRASCRGWSRGAFRGQQESPVRNGRCTGAGGHHGEHHKDAERCRLGAAEELQHAFTVNPLRAPPCVLCALRLITHDTQPIPSCPHSTPHAPKDTIALGVKENGKNLCGTGQVDQHWSLRARRVPAVIGDRVCSPARSATGRAERPQRRVRYPCPLSSVGRASPW